MRFLLDTNVVSEMRKPADKTSVSFREWLDSIAYAELYLSVISISEIETGMLRIARRDKTQGAILKSWLENSVLKAFDGHILPVTLEVARTAARMHVPDPAPQLDALIAATASSSACTIATRNTKDYVRFGVEVVNPWEHTS